ncbi:MAG: RsmE family RNA methyltransferase [bacterium]|jgi:16S rRNA (uracil1498-N3)-methyltransferase
MSALPLFYFSALKEVSTSAILDEETRRHVVTVLRMQPGETIMLTDGLGISAMATIEQADKKQLVVAVDKLVQHPAPAQKKILALSLLKNAARFEWMLEKITEIGITEIIPLMSERTERQHFRHERLSQIIVSASLQSGRFHFPTLHAPMKFQHLFDLDLPATRFIAHCMEGDKKKLVGQEQDSIVLIGPEGDFTVAEVELALQHQFCAVTLGNTRLRSETAGVVAAALLIS